jgi:ribonuclease BN (tRNA processing enzyme)
MQTSTKIYAVTGDAPMQISVLGAGTVLPADSRSASGYLVRWGGEQVLFDIGPGTVARLHAIGVSYRTLSRIVISHLHVDHVLDLVTLLQAYNATPGWTRTAPLQLIGCRGLREFVDNLCAIFGGMAPKTYPLDIIELPVGQADYDGFSLEAALTGHTDNSLAFRLVAEGRVMVYSGDAVETPALAQLARGADLFICECSFPQGTATANHLTADGAGRLAASAGVKHLLLTHLYPDTDDGAVREQASAVFGGLVSVAYDGMIVEVL